MILSYFRRPSTLAASWLGKHFVVHNYRLKTRIAVDPETISLLTYLDEWRSQHDIYSYMPDRACLDIDQALHLLLRHRLIYRKASAEALEDDLFNKKWGPWSPAAAWFHFSTKDVSYTALGLPTHVKIRELLQQSPEPPFCKVTPQENKRYSLQAHGLPTNLFYDVLRSRRHRRSFADTPVGDSTIANLLSCTWGIFGYQQTELLQPLPLKTSPSGGGRHPCEVYLMAINVTGIDPGYYYYSPVENALILIKEGATKEDAVKHCGGQEWAGGAAALFLMTAVFARSMWKYPNARTYRIVLAEVGHLCQTFCLAATERGLSCFSTMALADTAIEAILEVDGVSESILYVAGVGSSS